MAADWLRYANQGATRNRPLDPRLVGALSYLPRMGVDMEVFSGGQPTATEGGPRTGSVRHDHGDAADVFFYRDGRRLDWANPADVPTFEQIVSQGQANGVTGFGAGPGYMQPASMHVGFGSPGVWGAGGKGANAPDWLRTAYGLAAAGPQPAAPVAPTAFGVATGNPAAMGNPATTTPPNAATLASLFGAPDAVPAPAADAGSLAALYVQKQQAQKAEMQAAEAQKRAALFGDLFGPFA